MTWLSLPLGLLSWMIPIVFHKKKPAAVSAVSFVLCVLALLNVLWELYGRTVSGDYAALLDITDNVVWCSAALVVGTLLLNLWLHAPGGILRHLEKPARFFVVFLVTLVVQSALYVPGMQLAAYIKDRNQMVGSAIGAAISLIAYAGAIPLLILARRKESPFKCSWGVPLGILASVRIWSILFSLTCDYLRILHALPYEMDEAASTFAAYYLLPMVFISSVLTGSSKWEIRKQRRASGQQQLPQLFHVWPITKEAVKQFLKKLRLKPFAVTLLLQVLAFAPPMSYAAKNHPGALAKTLYCGLMLGLAILLLTVYLYKTEAAKLSFGVPLAVAVFPVLYHLITVQLIFRFSGRLYAVDASRFWTIYFFPVLLMTVTAVGWLRFLAWRKDHSLPKLTGTQMTILQVAVILLITVLVMAATLISPDIQLEKGEFLMLESDAPIFFAAAFGVATLLFGLFLLMVYRKRTRKTGLVCFLLQWVLTLAAFYFLMSGLTLRPGDVGGMYTETVSLKVGLAGLCWAASMVAMGYGLKNILDEKKGEPHEAE